MIDAMGTQKAIAKQIVEAGADDVLGLKGNHSTLLCDSRQGTRARGNTNLHSTADSPCLPGFDQWISLKSIGLLIHHCVRDGRATVEVRYYLSSLSVSVKRFARAVRSHWGIENSRHWSLDVTYREDESRIRNEHFRESFAWINRFTLSLLHQHPDPGSIAMKRLSCGWDCDYLSQVLTGNRS